MRVKIVGSGRVGAPLGAWFLQKGIKVSFSDINEELLKNVYEGWLDWEEPGLNAALRDGRSNMLDPDETNCDWTFITVGTPVDKDGQPILHHLEDVVREHYQNSNIVLRSTVAPGTCDKLAERFNTTIWHAPERLLLGNGMDELDELPQIVGCTENGAAGSYVLGCQDFHRAFGTIFPSFRFGTALEAECAKVSNNIVRYIEFATGTELAEQFAKLGANPQTVREMMIDGYKRGRLAFPSFVGSYCLNKDWYMLASATGETPTLASAAAKYNTNLPNKLLENLNFHGKTVLICGLTYKPNLDDCRETPSVALYWETFLKKADKILYHDPIVNVQETYETLWPDIPTEFEVVRDIADVMHTVDVLIIATAHDDYSALNYNDLKDGSIIVDPAYVVNRKFGQEGFVVEV